MDNEVPLCALMGVLAVILDGVNNDADWRSRFLINARGPSKSSVRTNAELRTRGLTGLTGPSLGMLPRVSVGLRSSKKDE